MNQNIYQFTGSRNQEIRFSLKQPSIFRYKEKKTLGDIGGGFLTLATGLGSSSSKDVIWKVDGSIEASDSLPDWNIRLFCDGIFGKDRERVRNDDGSWSVVTEETKNLFWDNDATGSIVEGTDTIGIFLIIMDPRTDSLLYPWSADVNSQNDARVKEGQRTIWILETPTHDIDFGIIGTIRDKTFALISNGSVFKTWIYLHNEFRCIYRADMDDNFIRKKDRVMPYLLIVDDIPDIEQRDLFRLAIMSSFLSKALKPGS